MLFARPIQLFAFSVIYLAYFDLFVILCNNAAFIDLIKKIFLLMFVKYISKFDDIGIKKNNICSYKNTIGTKKILILTQ